MGCWSNELTMRPATRSLACWAWRGSRDAKRKTVAARSFGGMSVLLGFVKQRDVDLLRLTGGDRDGRALVVVTVHGFGVAVGELERLSAEREHAVAAGRNVGGGEFSVEAGVGLREAAGGVGGEQDDDTHPRQRAVAGIDGSGEGGKVVAESDVDGVGRPGGVDDEWMGEEIDAAGGDGSDVAVERLLMHEIAAGLDVFDDQVAVG